MEKKEEESNAAITQHNEIKDGQGKMIILCILQVQHRFSLQYTDIAHSDNLTKFLFGTLA